MYFQLASSSFYFTLKGNLYFFLLLVVFFILFSFLIYRYTIPNISSLKKTILAVLRISIFCLITFLLFEPTLNLIELKKSTKYTYVFFDNSNSIVQKDSFKKSQEINEVYSLLTKSLESNFKIFSFADKVYSNVQLKNNLQGTNFNAVYNFINKNKDEINNAVIISDGILNQDEDPIYKFEKLEIPIFTIGIGDTTTTKDVEINNVSYSSNIYFNSETNIEISVLNKGFENQQFTINIYEEDKLIGQKKEFLNTSGFNKVIFKYKPSKIGEIKLKIEITKFKSEQTYINNYRVIYLNVLSNKINIGIISDAVSNDLSIIINSLKKEEDFSVKKFIKISNSKNWIEPNINSLDSIDIFYFINFPSKQTTTEEIKKYLSLIEKGKPYFISISNHTDFEKLKLFNKSLPITINSFTKEIQKVQPEIFLKEYTSNFSQVSSNFNVWNKLAPVDQIIFKSTLKTESKILVNSLIRNVSIDNPLLVIRNFGYEKSILLNAFNIWVWQFQLAETNPDFFNNFIIETAKWLKEKNQRKYFSVTTNKKNYLSNEKIEFNAELYDQSFNPIDTSRIKLKIIGTNDEIDFTPQGDGKYITIYTPNNSGELFFESYNSYYNNNYKTFNGRLYINEIPIEKISSKMNEDYLKRISFSTKGKYFHINDAKDILNEFKNLQDIKSEILLNKQIELPFNNYILFLSILFLAFEWTFRKLNGMI